MRTRRFLLVAALAALAQLDCHSSLAPSSPPAPSPAPAVARHHPIAAALVPAPPVALTASDGTGLKLSRVRARAVVEGPLAFTEARLAFDNPQDRTLEGTFRIALPRGASLARFAMRIGEQWQEGEVVEKQAAREAYEDSLHRRQDPALLEQAAGNEFSARVFPIPARATKEIVVAWVQEIAGDAPYVLPLRGLPEVGAIDVAAGEVGSRAGAASLVKENWQPDADFVVARAPSTANDGLRSGDLAVVRVRPVVEARPDPVRSAIVVIDTSASRALGFEEQIERVASVVERLGADAHVTIACFDQGVEEVFDGAAREFGDDAIARIRAHGALGASDLERAIAWSGARAKANRASRVILVTDGVATAGSIEHDALVAAARALSGSGVERLDAIAIGGIRDDDVLRAMATAGLAHDGVVADAADGADAVARRLSEATRSKIAVKVDGARWWWPQTIDGAQSGDETLVYAEIDAGKAPSIAVGGDAAREPRLATAERPLIERAWARAKIESLAERQTREGQDAARAKEILDLSVRNRVIGPSTAMLVLETDADYARFHVDRRALADILVVDAGRVARTQRSSAVLPPAVATEKNEGFGFRFSDDPLAPGAPPAASAAPAPEQDAREATGHMFGGEITDSFGSGGLGLSGVAEGGGGRGEGIGLGSVGTVGHGAGTGSDPSSTATAAATPAPPVAGGGGQGFGPGHGRLGGSHRARPPSVRMGAVSVSGSAGGAGGRAEEGSMGKTDAIDPYTGRFADVMRDLEHGDTQSAIAAATSWRSEDPGDVMALVALGEALEATGAKQRAERAYGSIVDLFPSRADMRRFAGERLERIAGDDAALDLAIDTYAKADEQRPDHPSSHRLLAYALLRRGRYAEAFDAAVAGLAHPYPGGRFRGVDQVMREDVGLVGAAWAKSEPAKRAEIAARVRAAGGTIEDEPSLRFVLTWETDANDVDLHVEDARGGHAFYSSPKLPSGGSLYADVTTGYGPECFTIRAAPDHRAGPYRLRANYYSRGPMGYGMGKLEIVEHDGHGGIRFEERPFVVMNDHAFVDLGVAQR